MNRINNSQNTLLVKTTVTADEAINNDELVNKNNVTNKSQSFNTAYGNEFNFLNGFRLECAENINAGNVVILKSDNTCSILKTINPLDVVGIALENGLAGESIYVQQMDGKIKNIYTGLTAGEEVFFELNTQTINQIKKGIKIGYAVDTDEIILASF